MRRWGKITTMVITKAGLSAVKKGIVRYPGLLATAFYVGTTGDIAGATAEAMGIPREAASALINAKMDEVTWGLPAPTGGIEVFTFKDGDQVTLGDYFTLFVIDQHRKIEQVIDGEVCDLSLAGYLPPHTVNVSVAFYNPAANLHQVKVFRANRISAPLDVGDFVPDRANSTEYSFP